MSLAHVSMAKPAFFDAELFGDRVPRAPAGNGGAGRATTLDDPDLCPHWPVPPRPWAEALATLPSLPAQFAQLTVGDGYCGNGSGPRPPLPHAF